MRKEVPKWPWPAPGLISHHPATLDWLLPPLFHHYLLPLQIQTWWTPGLAVLESSVRAKLKYAQGCPEDPRQLCPTLCDPMDCSTPGLPVHPQLPEVYSNSCPLSWWCYPTISSSVIPSPPTLNLSQHQGLSQWVSSLHQVAKVLGFQLQHQSFQWMFRTDFL